jgi:ribosomal protein S18 acetylase RimI-like enzyme
MNLTFRVLDKRDVSQYKDIRLQLLQNHPMSFGSSHEEESLFDDSMWINRMVKATVKTLGAFDEETLIGICALAFSPRIKMKHIAEIHSMYVKQEYRNQNIGYTLIQMAFDLCIEKDVEIIRLSVVDGNDSAINLYKKLGFMEYGIEKKTIKYENKYYDLVLMDKNF